MSSNEESLFQVREYQPSDFRQLCALDRLCFPEAIAYSPEEVAFGLSQPGAFALVAEVRGEVVAFILACQKKRRAGHIITIDVRPEFHRKGIGSKLMRLAEERLRETGSERIALEVGISNENALRFYRELGFTEKRFLPRYYPDGSHACLMEKALG